MESTGTAKAEAESRAEAARIEGHGSVLQAKLKAEALAIETVSGGGALEGCGLLSLPPSGMPSALIFSSTHMFVVFKVPCPLSIHFLPAWKTQMILILIFRVICARTLGSFVPGIAYVLHA